MNQQTHNDCHHKHSQQPQCVQYVSHGGQLGSDHATDSYGGVPGESCLDSIEHKVVYNGAKGVQLMVYSVMIQKNLLLMSLQSKKRAQIAINYELVAKIPSNKFCLSPEGR